MNPNYCEELEGTRILDGQTFKEMFSFATEWFAKSESDVNILNVFPVPDGDTGTNMLLTMRSSIDETSKRSDQSVSDIAKAMAHGSLMGARGNSGVIYSQIWRGLARSFQGKDNINGRDLAAAFGSAAVTAYEGLENPVEGTMLTVMKEIASSTHQYLDGKNENVVAVLQIAVEAASKAVANTPNLLPVLKEAGVVDSGGQGIYIWLEGALMFLKGQTEELKSSKSKIISTAETNKSPQISDLREEVPFGYCTEFILKGEELDPGQIRKRLKKKGQSLIVVGDESNVKIHIHALDPSPVIHYALSLGTISAVSIRNMDEQYDDLLRAQEEKNTEAMAMAVVAVATGEGIIDTFKKLGAAAIVSGGKTMNPSTKEILRAVESIRSDTVIILPNDKNLVLVAQQVATLTKKNVQVLPTVTIPQGIAALLAFNSDADLQTNLEQMAESKAMVKTVEVTRATRSTRVNGFVIRKNQAIGLLDGKLSAVSDSMIDVVMDILTKVDLGNAETIYIYCGNGTDETQALRIKEKMYQRNPKLNVDISAGGHPLYDFLISIE